LKAGGLNWNSVKISTSIQNCAVLKEKKKGRLVPVHCLPRFTRKKQRGNLLCRYIKCLISPSNRTKFARNGSPAIPLQPYVNVSGWMTERWRREEINSGSLFLQIWQLRKATLNQRLGSLPTKSRAKILPRCRRDYPLLLPINRGSVDDLREKKIKCKVGQKPAFPALFSCKRSFLFFLSPPWPSATTTIITCLLTIVPTSSSHQTITRGCCTTSLSPL